jgi:hypothetical protein
MRSTWLESRCDVHMSRPPNQGIATAEAVSDGGMALFDPARVWNRFLPMSSLDKPAAVSILSRGVVDWDVGLELSTTAEN